MKDSYKDRIEAMEFKEAFLAYEQTENELSDNVFCLLTGLCKA